MELMFIKDTRGETLDVEFTVKRINFRNEDGGFSYLTVKAQRLPKGRRKKVEDLEVRGCFPMVYEGEVFQAKGDIQDDYTKGPYFQIHGMPQLKQPQIEKEILLFFKKRVKGLGLKTAKQIIEALGLDCLSKIQANEQCLLAIPSMTEKKAKKIKAALVAHQSFEALLLFLQRYHLEPRLANLLFQEFQADAVTMIKQNPYLMTRLPHVSFTEADTLAVQLGWAFDSQLRIRQALLSYLNYRSESKGDMCIRQSRLVSELNFYVQHIGCYKGEAYYLSAKSIKTALDYLIAKNLVFMERLENQEAYLYSTLYHKVESGLVEALVSMLMDEHANELISTDKVEQVILEKEKKNYVLDPLQKQAIHMPFWHRISILTGGPGTGKTASTHMIVQVFEELFPNASILLLAPTGKAAKRMTEVSKRPALTIHRAIGLRGGESETKKTVDADLVIVDESSMVDAYVFYKLLTSIAEHTRVVLVGDYEQLPSVGPGLILRDLINSERIPVTRLTTIFRQAQESQIVMNSYAVIKGMTESLTFDHSKGDFYFVPAPSVQVCRAKLLQSFKRMLDVYKYPLGDICLLTPMRAGELGVESLNQAVQALVNPPHPLKSECLTPCELLIREGDRVLHTANNEELNVFNGEVGIVKTIEFVNHEPIIHVAYPDKEEWVIYKGKSGEELELAYCLSIHKSQGSEFPVVITPIHPLHHYMLNRNLIYTAWTRAKERVICIGETEVLTTSLTKGDNVRRLSRVKEKLEKRIERLA